MTLVQRMDEFIDKLESNDKTVIEQLNAEFKQYCEEIENKKLSRKRR